MQKVIDRRKISCPRCGSAGSLSSRDDYYGKYLGCLICGWHGETDENGYPVMVEIPPPPIRRRRRRKKGATGLPGEPGAGAEGESPVETPGENALDSSGENPDERAGGLAAELAPEAGRGDD